jgi:glutamate-1-semialdehyde 2,1-aminomutase
MLQTLTIFDRYLAKTPGSKKLYHRAAQVIPGGVTHDTRYLQPYPLYVARASRAHKWDVDGNQYVDYIGGHGALLLGHSDPFVTEAVREQLGRGTHYGAAHELEVEWAEQVTRMVPCAAKVRFTGSGTESTLLAIRLARAYTEKPKIIRFVGHFHGWHDQVAFAATSHFDGSAPPGVLPEVAENALVCPVNDVAALEKLLAEHDDVAAVIMEPTGATFGLAPLMNGFAAKVRELTAARNVLLIFDEVITGFRVAPGGAQQLLGVSPDLCTFAKIIAGGLPGGAVAGRADVMDTLTMRADHDWNLNHRVPHQGTFNANPITAAAGLATLKLIAEGGVIERANRAADHLRTRMNEAIAEVGVNWLVYGAHSGFHVFTNPKNVDATLADISTGKIGSDQLKGATPPAIISRLRCGMILGGADVFPWPGGVVSAAHTEDDIDTTVAAFKSCLELLAAESA